MRVTLGGEELTGFPDDSGSAYVKLKMTDPPPDSNERPMIRTYTVRRFDSTKLKLDIDFVLHADQGPASDWAKAARPGDRMTILGPGPKKLVDYSADWFLLAGDMYVSSYWQMGKSEYEHRVSKRNAKDGSAQPGSESDSDPSGRTGQLASG